MLYFSSMVIQEAMAETAVGEAMVRTVIKANPLKMDPGGIALRAQGGVVGVEMQVSAVFPDSELMAEMRLHCTCLSRLIRSQFLMR
jgi:hypothetical protein